MRAFNERYRTVNEKIAVRVTLSAFTMEAVYLCVLLSVLPVIKPAWMETVLFISNAVQLTLLSIVGVGTAVMSRQQESRAAADHAALMELVGDLHAMTLLRQINQRLAFTLSAWLSPMIACAASSRIERCRQR